MRNTYFHAESSAAQNDSFVVPEYDDKKALVESLNATGGNAADQVRAFPPRGLGQATVKTAIAANADAAVLNGDAAAGNQINGQAVAANDFLLLELDARHPQRGNWQLMLIAAVNGAAANGEIDITNLTAFDAEQVPRAASAVNKRAYIIFAEDVRTLLIGNTTVLDIRRSIVGFAGHPLALVIDGNAAALHRITGTIAYVD
ncbi:hypothetical protein [Pararhizobium sp.]|uniref:hypothetical protein n=1 Tax=Pararhizobium sp. TaxID=1977563 RepID=UPI003D0C4175